MGSDNLFYKRKARKAAELRRQAERFEPYHRVLIVTEGTKTEPNYFTELRSEYELSTVNVPIDCNCGSDPLTVVDHAIHLYKEEKKKGDPFDRVYCVIDRDTHPRYSQATAKLNSQKPVGVFNLAKSEPCFEYWFLCHFRFTRAPISSTGRGSACDEMERLLRQEWAQYRKGIKDSFPYLKDKLEIAKTHARRGLKDAELTDSPNPSTNVHDLVEYLQNLKGYK